MFLLYYFALSAILPALSEGKLCLMTPNCEVIAKTGQIVQYAESSMMFCKTRCEEDPSCQSFSFTKWGYNCILFSDVRETRAHKSPDWFCAQCFENESYENILDNIDCDHRIMSGQCLDTNTGACNDCADPNENLLSDTSPNGRHYYVNLNTKNLEHEQNLILCASYGMQLIDFYGLSDEETSAEQCFIKDYVRSLDEFAAKKAQDRPLFKAPTIVKAYRLNIRLAYLAPDESTASQLTDTTIYKYRNTTIPGQFWKSNEPNGKAGEKCTSLFEKKEFAVVNTNCDDAQFQRDQFPVACMLPAMDSTTEVISELCREVSTENCQNDIFLKNCALACKAMKSDCDAKKAEGLCYKEEVHTLCTEQCYQKQEDWQCHDWVVSGLCDNAYVIANCLECLQDTYDRKAIKDCELAASYGYCHDTEELMDELDTQLSTKFEDRPMYEDTIMNCPNTCSSETKLENAAGDEYCDKLDYYACWESKGERLGNRHLCHKQCLYLMCHEVLYKSDRKNFWLEFCPKHFDYISIELDTKGANGIKFSSDKKLEGELINRSNKEMLLPLDTSVVIVKMNSDGTNSGFAAKIRKGSDEANAYLTSSTKDYWICRPNGSSTQRAKWWQPVVDTSDPAVWNVQIDAVTESQSIPGAKFMWSETDNDNIYCRFDVEDWQANT